MKIEYKLIKERYPKTFDALVESSKNNDGFENEIKFSSPNLSGDMQNPHFLPKNDKWL